VLWSRQLTPATRVVMLGQRLRTCSSISASPVGNVISSAVPGGTSVRSRTALTSRERGPRRDRSGLHPQHRLDQVGMELDDRLGQKTTVIFDDSVLKFDMNFFVCQGLSTGMARHRSVDTDPTRLTGYMIDLVH